MRKSALREVIDQVGPLPFRLVGKWIIQICNELKLQNKNGRDSFIPISPFWLNVTDSLNISPLPQSLSCSVIKKAESVPTDYWSPEQVKGEDLSRQSTFFSLGVIAYEMLTGVLPFPSDSKSKNRLINTHVYAPKVSFKRSKVPPVLDLIVVKLLSKDLTKRFGSSDEIAEIISRMSLNEDETGLEARKAIDKFFNKDKELSRTPTLSIKTNIRRQSQSLTKGSGKGLDSNRVTVQRKTAVYQGPPEWEDSLRVVAGTEKVTFTWKTETESAYSCKVARRGSSAPLLAAKEDKAAIFHQFEVPGLEPDTGYSATIFNETDFVMKSFKTTGGPV